MSDFDAVFSDAIGSTTGKKTTEENPFDVLFEQSFKGTESPKIDLPKAPEVTTSADYRAGRQVSNPVARGVINAVNGPLLGFGDEVLGALGALGKIGNGQPFGQNYQETRDMYRGVQDQYKEDFPIGSVATQLATSAPAIMANPLGKGATSIASAVAPKTAASIGNWIAPANQVAGIVPRTVQAASSGFGYGAVSGAGESTSETAGGVAADALRNGAISAAVGGATPGVQSVLGAVGSNVASRVSDSVAGNFARQKVAEAFMRDGRGTLAEQGLANPIDQALPRLFRYGDEARLVDVGGKSTQGLLDTVATLPGRSKNLVEDAIRTRQAGRAGRLVDAADNALGTGGREFGNTLETLDSVRKTAAAPFYRQIESATATIDDDLVSLIQRTEGVHGEAQKLYRLQTGQNLDLSKVGKGDQIPFSMLDTLKQSLYDAADTAKRQGSNKMGAAFDSVRTQLIKKLDDISPVDEAGQSIYKLARDAYAGPSQLMNAAEVGRTAMKADSFVVKDAIKGLSDSELQAFRVGALQALKEKTGTQSGQTSLLKMWMEPATSGRLKDIFGNDYRNFAAAVGAEARMKGLEQVGRGSQTAARQFGAGDLDLSALSSLASASSGSVATAIPAMASAWNRVQTPVAVRDEIGRILLSRDPRTLQSMRGLIGDLNQSRANTARQAGAWGGLLSSQ